MAVQADGAVADDGVADAVVGTGAAVHHQDLLPLTGCVVVIGFQTVALNDNRLLRRAVNDELAVAPREDAAALVAIHLGARFNPQGSIRVDECIAVEDVWPFLGPHRGLKAVGNDVIGIRHAANVNDLVGHDVVGVLSPGQELNGLRVAVGDELQLIFHHERRIEVVRVDGDAQEREETVLGGTDFVVNLGGTLAVKVEAERGSFAPGKAYGTDFQVIAVLVVDH